MKRTLLAVFALSLTTLSLESLSAEEPNSNECIDTTYEIVAGSEAITRTCGEFQTISVYIPAKTAILSVHEIQKKGTAKQTYSPLVVKNTILIASGGFFGYRSDGHEKPIGLIRANNKRLVRMLDWDHGGVLVSDKKGNIKIIPAQNRSQAGAWSEAIQSKPIIINSGMVDVNKNLRDSEFNRVAIGYTLDGDILVVGTFHSFGQAATLVDFAKIFKSEAERRELKIHRALAMDGGAGAQIYIPSKNLSFGDSGRSYFPNAVRLDATNGVKWQ